MSIGLSGRPTVGTVQDALMKFLFAGHRADVWGTTKHCDLVFIKGERSEQSAYNIAFDIGQPGCRFRLIPIDGGTLIALDGADDHEWDWDPKSLEAFEALSSESEKTPVAPVFSAFNPPDKRKTVEFTKIAEPVRPGASVAKRVGGRVK